MSNTRKLWLGLGALLVISFGVLLWAGTEIFRAAPPVPERVVSQGGSLLQPVVASRLLERMAAPPERAPDALTERELEVLQHLAQGKANKEIAAALVISERTVKFHVSSILGKLGAANRTEAVRVGVQRGLVSM